MADTPSSILLLRLQSTGSNTNLWGGYLNTALSTIERASKGYQALAVTGDATISWTNYSASNDGSVAFLKLTGSLSSAATLTFPSYQHELAVWNATGAAVTIKCSGGTGVSIPNGMRTRIYCDATDYYSSGTNWLNSYQATLTNSGDVVVKATLESAIAALLASTVAGLVFNSSADPTPNYLANKLAAAGALSLSTTGAGTASEKSTFSVGVFALTQGSAQTTSFSAAVNTRYTLTKSGDVTITMPASASAGDVLQFEIGGTSGIVTFSLNGLKFYGSTSNPTSSGQGIQTFVYHSASVGWIDQ